ncbi:YggS family pyridoxal phosphate-dependent enzyme [Vagococcus xieshaowenii]|uniref:Pyridoxal phosphate homeostasis protein n=1 Tax=Vagococcus xieshaowenii TaxID=2562451 RepID=A0AAJ5JQZ6_9ENTE|nr:YggS family pyridoxal phosphate-dependent enzyme [Vagococcus xieshaowenii]QCA28985.1 YggS family pyridoxal phosphate-dependent enzyme [Vagococcus xieshaowenii]TFZ43166.1 YggS family pyridoxal phosphate-dependent enzyme [Vagococcus xieshaowenii]
MSLEKNLNLVKESISQASIQSSRHQEVTLIAVTKTVSSDVVKEAIQLGLSHFAENRSEKLIEKQEALEDYHTFTWHLIGTLQTRKVKDVINRIDYFHALDRIKTAQEIQKRATKTINCFVQVNVSGEISKQGISLDEVEPFIRDLAQFSAINVVGLMTMAPNGEEPEKIKEYFGKLALKQQEIANLTMKHAPCTELSMGMSKDYPLAISQGATFIRVGSQLFD